MLNLYLGYLVPAQPGFLPAATMMQPPTAVSSSATSSGQQHQPPTSSQGHLKEKVTEKYSGIVGFVTSPLKGRFVIFSQ